MSVLSVWAKSTDDGSDEEGADFFAYSLNTPSDAIANLRSRGARRRRFTSSLKTLRLYLEIAD